MKRLCILLVCSFIAAPLFGQVCYNPTTRGLTTSRYELDNLGSGFKTHAMDLTADPGAVGANPNRRFLNLDDPAVKAAFEKRYGKYTACSNPAAPGCDGHSHKRWAGGGNEVKSIWKEALEWWFQTHPGSLGPPCGGDGKATEVEIIDTLATNDLQIIIEHHNAMPGGSTENPIHVCDKTRPKGPFSKPNGFWPWTDFFFNDCEPDPRCGDGRCNGTETHQTCPGDCPCPPLQPFVTPPDVTTTLKDLQSWNVLMTGRHARTKRVGDWVKTLDKKICGTCTSLQPIVIPPDVTATLKDLQAWNVLGPGRHARTKRVMDWVKSLATKQCVP